MTGLRLVLNRRVLIAACCIAGLGAFLGAGSDSAQAAGASGPDVTVFAFTDIGSYGASGGFAGYALGTTSCNRGDAPLNWCDQGSGCAAGAGPKDHPVIAQNLYRLKSGRFEQIGMSWLKHGFTSLNQSSAGCTGSAGQSCQSPPAGGNQLGVGCTDPYTASLNGSRPLGRRSEVNATTGVFPFPFEPRRAVRGLRPADQGGHGGRRPGAATPAPLLGRRGSTSPATTRAPATRSTTPRTAGSPSAPAQTSPCR